MKTPYEILGLDETADIIVAKKTWKLLLRELHPDLHPEKERERLTEEVSIINSAWQAINKGWRPTITRNTGAESNINDIQYKAGSKIETNYKVSHPSILKIVNKIKESEKKDSVKWWFKNLLPSLLRFKLPKRDMLHILLCTAVVIEDDILTFVFHNPVFKGRNLLIMPEIKPIPGGIDVKINKPKSIFIETEYPSVETIEYPDNTVIEKSRIKEIYIHLPDKNLDTTKAFKYLPDNPLLRFIYKR